MKVGSTTPSGPPYHIPDPLRDVCIACGRTALELVERPVPCGGTVRYREWLRGLTWSREPIIPEVDHGR